MYRLTVRASADLDQILDNVLDDAENGGADAAAYLFSLLADFMERVAAGKVIGHQRHDLMLSRSVLFATARPTQYVLAFDATTRDIVRIIHGARDFPRVFEI